jgi:hypothetical protein
MPRRFQDRVGQFLKTFLEDYFGGPMHRLMRMQEQKTREELGFTADVERGRNADSRHSAKIVAPTPRRSAAEERRRIDDRPVP